MPTPRPRRAPDLSDPAYYLDRLARQPNALLWDEDFARNFGRLPRPVRDQIMARATDANVTPRQPPLIERTVYDAREIQWTPPDDVPLPSSSETRVSWPDPHHFGPGRYDYLDEALFEFNRQMLSVDVNGEWYVRHAEGRAAICRLFSDPTPPAPAPVPPPPPPPTTTPWEPRGDIETMTMIKSLPRSGRAVVVYPHRDRLFQILDCARQELPQPSHRSVVFNRLEFGRASLERLRARNYPIFIDHSVFDFHAEGRLDWPEGLLDELIALQAEIPDEEENPS